MTETLRAGTLKTKESMDKQNLAVDEWWNTTCFSKCVKHKWDILGRWNPMQKPLTALEMLWREHVYWFYYCNQQQKNASRMLAHCRGPSTDAIPASLLLFITLTQHFLLFPPKNSILFDNPCIFSEVALSADDSSLKKQLAPLCKGSSFILTFLSRDDSSHETWELCNWLYNHTDERQASVVARIIELRRVLYCLWDYLTAPCGYCSVFVNCDCIGVGGL